MDKSIRVLAVDDEDYMLKILKVCLPSPVFQLTTCSDAMGAMSVFKQGNFDLVILDVVMPGIDGFELHSLIRHINQNVPIIMLTAKIDDIDGTMISRISNDKNTYYQSKGFKKDELVARITGIVNQLKREESRRVYFEEMERDIALAGEVQHAMFPHWNSIQDGVHISFFYRPYMKITGDLFNLIPISDGVYLAIIGDISGHGIQAALCMSAIQFSLVNMIRNARTETLKPHVILNHLQSFLVNIVDGRYMTCIVGIVDYNKNTVSYQNAGHPDFILYSPKEEAILEVNPGKKGSLPVGLVRGHVYTESDSVTVDFPPDSIFFFYTDGLTDLQDKIGRTYKTNPLHEFVGTFAKHGLTNSTTFRIVDALFKLGFDEIKDDISLAAVARHVDKPHAYDYSIKPMVSAVDEFASGVSDYIVRTLHDDMLAARIEILISEFLNNVVVHGLGNKNMNRPIISAHLEFSENQIVLDFCDKGKEWDMRSEAHDEDTQSDVLNYQRATSGRGLSLIKKITSSIRRSRYAGLLNETVFTVDRK